ncbi:DNA-directed RNA polymerase II subunit Rpb10 [Tubulinosema ratisbonensis]|uniref:DNA-directed RNA polymerases I, II, and III subunit RPABC5 n=1 Tax=Tubulinosema ratisbonensis TaxID=291195 RepID=A0A437AHX9_9MICR|nr:DNA-directed RNA polymerase II subunit Rpb10 [Tubulinosema ratisbonensis]
MIIPIRCFTCGKEISSHWDQYVDLINQGHTENESLNILGFRRPCCRRMYLGHVDIHGNFLPTDAGREKTSL